MPQKSGIPDGFTPSSGYYDSTPDGFTPASGYYDSQQPQEQPEQSWTDWGIENALRTGPSIIGGIGAGLLATPETLGSATIPAYMAGSAALAGVGQYLGDWYSGKESSPLEYAVTMGAGAIPGMIGPSMAKTVGGRMIGNFARSAAEGALQNVAVSPFEEYAQTGNWIPSLEKIGKTAATGALFGGPIGSVTGAITHPFQNAARRAASGVDTGVAHGPTPSEGFFPQPPEGYTPPYRDRTIGGDPLMPEPVYGPEVGPYGTPRAGGIGQENLALGDIQQDLPFGSYRGAGGRFAKEGPGLPPKYGPEVGGPPPGPDPYTGQGTFGFNDVPPAPLLGNQGAFDFGPTSVQEAPPPVQIPPVNQVPNAPVSQAPPAKGFTPHPEIPGVQVSQNGQLAIVSAPSQANVKMLIDRGFTQVKGLVSPDNFPIMVRGDVAPLYVTGDKKLPPVKPAPAPTPTNPIADAAPGAIAPGMVPVEGTVRVAKNKVTKSYLENMIEGGYKVAGEDATHVTFVLEDPQASRVGDDSVEFTPDEQPQSDVPLMTPEQNLPSGPVPRAPLRPGNWMGVDTREAATRIINETKLDVAEQNFRELDQGLAIAKRKGDPNQINASNYLREIALNHYKRMRDRAGVGEVVGPTPPRARGEMPEAARKFESDDLFKGSEGKGLGKESFEQQWEQAIREAKLVGLDYTKYDNLDQLQWDITRAAAQETVRTGKNPLANTPEAASIRRNKKALKEAEEIQRAQQALDRNKAIQRLYDSMEQVPVAGTKRTSLIYDPGGRLNGEEFTAITRNPAIKNLMRVYDNVTDDILKAVNNWAWMNRLEGTGLILEPTVHGLHVPNPATGKSSILLNPASWGTNKNVTPREMAWKNVITIAHEVAHVGKDKATGVDSPNVRLTDADMNDPRVGDFLRSYMEEIKNYTNTGTGSHGLDFAYRLAEAYGKLGVDGAYKAADRIHSAITDKSGGYSPDFQEFLHQYSESRRRVPTTEDHLTRTGVKQANRGRTGKGSIPGDPEANRDGAITRLQRMTDNPVVAKFRQMLQPARSFDDTYFMLPDGTRLTFDHVYEPNGKTRYGGITHDEQSRLIGYELPETLKNGIIRFAAKGNVEVGGPITYAQAEHLADPSAMGQSVYGDRQPTMFVDVRLPDGNYATRMFPENRATPEAIRNWINSHFKPEVPEASRVQDFKNATGVGMGGAVKKKEGELNLVKEALAVPSSLTTTGDLSAPGRQGLSMILTPQFWKAAGAMFGGLTEKGFNAIDADLRSKPIHQRTRDPETGKVSKSFAEQIGMKLFTPASRPGPRAEGVASRWLETGGNIPYASAFYRNTLGAPIRMSNRAYITFLNHLNTNRTEFLLDSARKMSIEALTTGKARQGIMPWKTKFTPEEAQNLNPYHNKVLAREIAEFVNTATGHGPLKTHILPHKSTEISLESAASKLGYVLFSPGLLASRIRMLNPSTYIMATPFVRKQYLKAAMGSVAAWGAFTTLAKMGGAEVGDDPTSADFGKVRIGDTRIDPGAGFLQFVVLANRMYQGGYTSSATNEFHRFGEGFQAETQLSNLMRFASNKLNPAAKFAYDVANASEYNPFHVKDRTAQMFVPLFAQDVIELAKEDPNLVPWLAPMLFGVGAQTYSKGESVGKLVNPENDWLATGGGVADLGPDYIHPRLDY